MTTQQKISAVNSWTIPSPQKAILSPSTIVNAIVPADLAALSTAALQVMLVLLAGSSIDASIGTTVRIGFQTLFSGKNTTLSQLGALVSPFDNATTPWITSSSGARLNGVISQTDCDAAGLS
jgi:hypothetical protein